MKTMRVSFFGIPAHVILNDVPGSLLPAASVCDVLYLIGGDRSWSLTGFRLLQLGNASALLAAVFGVLDWLRLPAVPAVRRLGRRHLGLNALVLPLCLLCQAQRRRRPEQPSRAAMALLLAANVGLNVSAWHGARLVHGYQVRTGEHEPPAPLSARVDEARW